MSEWFTWPACCVVIGSLSFCWFTARHYRRQFEFQESILDRERDRRRAMLKTLDALRAENARQAAQLDAIQRHKFTT